MKDRCGYNNKSLPRVKDPNKGKSKGDYDSVDTKVLTPRPSGHLAASVATAPRPARVRRRYDLDDQPAAPSGHLQAAARSETGAGKPAAGKSDDRHPAR